MILKSKWISQNMKNKDVAYNPKRKNKFIVSDKHMSTGKPVIEAKFEAEVAPLIVINGIRFQITPHNGDFLDVSLDNMLLSGPGKHKGLKRENAVKNEILRLKYDSEEAVFSYIYRRNGCFEELRYKNFEALRNRVSQSPSLHGLRNKKYLLTPQEYLCLYDDYVDGLIRGDKDFDILSYKFEDICEP